MNRKRSLILFLLLILLIPQIAGADPFPLDADLADTMTLFYDPDHPDAGSYVWSYRYPRILPDTPGADLINGFYESLADDARDFGMPILADYLRTNGGISGRTEVDYLVTCNNGDAFSVLLHTRETVGETTSDFYAGHTFSLTLGKAGATLTLPQLLSILDATESDPWLQDRQTARADEVTRALVWEQLEARADSIPCYDDLTRDAFDGCFYPEEDFYLNDTGNPVFFLQPGAAAPESAGLLLFPVTLEEIWDEM